MHIHTYFLCVHQGRTVTLKLKTSGFEVKQRSMSFPTLVDSFTDIHKAARTLLETEMKNNTQLKLRLMGISSKYNAAHTFDTCFFIFPFHTGVRLSGLEGTSNSPSKNKRSSTVSLDNFFSPEQDSSTSKRIKIEEDNFENPDTTLTEVKVLHLPELTVADYFI